MGEIFFHIDVNNAFLSWSAVEALKNGSTTDYRLIPVVVGGDIKKRHGVVVAKSDPAKKTGVKTGEPLTDALKKCPSLISIPPDHKLYREYSKRMLDLLSGYFNEISPYSIDECFAKYDPVTAKGKEPVEYAFFIKDLIRDTFGFTVNIGISENKLLAKMASDFQKPDKVHTLFKSEIKEKMWPLPIRDLFFVGNAAEHSLKGLGIKTIGDLAAADPKIIESHLKTHGRILWEYANGMEISPIDEERKSSKGIGNSTTLESDIISADDAYKILGKLCESVSRRLKKEHMVAGSICVEIKYSDFTSVSHQMAIPTPSSQKEDLHKYADLLFDRLWSHAPIRLLGVRTGKLSPDTMVQLSIFDMEDAFSEKGPVSSENNISPENNASLRTDSKKKALDKALDKIRRKYGDNAVKKGNRLK